MANLHSNILDTSPTRSNFLYFHAVFGINSPGNPGSNPAFYDVLTHHHQWGDLGGWVIFFLGECCKLLKHQVQDICGQVHWLKNRCWPMVKICPKIINCLFCAQNLLTYAQKKNLPKIKNFSPKFKKLPIESSSLSDETTGQIRCLLCFIADVCIVRISLRWIWIRITLLLWRRIRHVFYSQSSFFQNEEIFVQLDELDELDRITYA